MGPEDSVKDIEVYANGLRVGSLTEIKEPTTIEPTEPLALGNNFCNVNTDGNYNNNNASWSAAVLAGFYDDTRSHGVTFG